MKITIFGIVCFILVVIAFIKNNANIMLILLVMGMNLQSASVFVLNGQGVGFQIVISTVFIIWAFFQSNVFLHGKLVIEKGISMLKISIVAAILFGVYCMITTVNQKVVENNYTRYLYLAQLLIYIVCYWCCGSVSRKFYFENVDRIIVRVIVVIAIIGFIQVLTTVNILPRNIILETFIYTKDTPSAYYLANFYPRIFSVFMEPSYCAAFLVGGFYYLISRDKLNRYCVSLAIILIIEILLTFSSTAYGAFFVTGLIYLVMSKNKKALKWLIPLAIMMGMVLLATGALQEALSDVIFNKAQTASAYTREGWDKKAMAVFHDNPWFGVGYKGVRGSHLYTSILGQLGIVGMTLYVLMILPLIIAGLKSKRTTSATLFLIGSIISQLIALPDLDFCVFWEGMYIMALMLGMAKGESGYESVNNNSGI